MSLERKRMALLPHGTNVTIQTPAQHLWVPIVEISWKKSKVIVLPGVPRLFCDLIDSYMEHVHMPRLQSEGHTPWLRKLVGTSKWEAEIAPDLNTAQIEATKYQIKIGSYPKSPPVKIPPNATNEEKIRLMNLARVDPEWKLKVVVSFVGKDQAKIDEMAEMVRQRIDGWIVAPEE
jgi:molybdopterin-biosynthesis enzyme MoeA-like protein